MATLGAKTTDSNYAVPLVNKTSGAPQGFMDMSSLASVLGGFKFTPVIPKNSDLNTLEFRLTYRSSDSTITATLSNLPSDLILGGFYMLWISSYGSEAYSNQIIIQYGKVWIRNATDLSGKVWNAWQKVTLEAVS